MYLKEFFKLKNMKSNLFNLQRFKNLIRIILVESRTNFKLIFIGTFFLIMVGFYSSFDFESGILSLRD